MVISVQRLVNIYQLDVNFLKINNIFWASNKQSRYWNWFFDSWKLHLRRQILTAWCDEYVMIHYNSKPNAYCRAVNAETYQTMKHNPVWISILLYKRNPYSYSYFAIVVCIYSVRGAIDQMTTNTPSYTICSAPIVYICVYIFIEICIAPLISSQVRTLYYGVENVPKNHKPILIRTIFEIFCTEWKLVTSLILTSLI